MLPQAFGRIIQISRKHEPGRTVASYGGWRRVRRERQADALLWDSSDENNSALLDTQALESRQY
jgi:hypothetical protein